MHKKTIIITSHAKLRIEKGYLLIEQEEIQKFTLNDITTILVETTQCSVTSSLLLRLLQEDISIFFCNEKHQPALSVLPIVKNSHKSGILQEQIHFPKRATKRIWQKIIKQKIANQMEVLKKVGASKTLIQEMNKLRGSTEEGDITHCEAHAARIYFGHLFPKDEKRHDETPINSALNYGYAIVRGKISQVLILHGLEASLGVWHNNIRNAFNLSDDLIEVFRPMIDFLVFSNVWESEDLGKEDKIKLLSILQAPCMLNGAKTRVVTAIDELVISYLRCLRKKSAAHLKLPTMEGAYEFTHST